MRSLGLLLAFLALSAPPFARAYGGEIGGAQEIEVAQEQEIDAPEGSIIRSVEVSGLPLDRLGSPLRADINALAGDPLNLEHVRQLANRIEAEHPDVVVTIRGIAAPDNGVRIVFLAARIGDDPNLEVNINARYTVESVDVEGVAESQIGDELRRELQTLVGRPLDHDEAERLEKRLAADFPGYDVRRRVSRGSRRGRLRLVFGMNKTEALRWIHFAPSQSKLLFHSEQGWSGLLDLRIGNRDFRVSPIFAFDNADDLIEEYSGFGVRIEGRNLATERLGLGLELSRFEQTWEPVTLAALAAMPDTPEAYRTRSTVAPLVTFAFTPRLRASAGVSITELESLTRTPLSQMANAFIGSIGFDQRWEGTSDASHAVEASFSWRSALTALESDLVYQRYLVGGNYQFRRRRNTVLVAGSLGRITGGAPLFERFTLGDSSTLRGWDKYDISPAGGDRMYYTSLEYRNSGLAFFLDAGSAWDRDTEAKARVATGFGLHLENVFITLGFPLNTDDVDAVFTMGVRF